MSVSVYFGHKTILTNLQEENYITVHYIIFSIHKATNTEKKTLIYTRTGSSYFAFTTKETCIFEQSRRPSKKVQPSPAIPTLNRSNNTPRLAVKEPFRSAAQSSSRFNFRSMLVNAGVRNLSCLRGSAALCARFFPRARSERSTRGRKKRRLPKLGR